MTESSVRINSGSKVPLSAQELIDCDTDYNRGCLGGNPIFAFEYIMSEGLSGWYAYPYKEQSGRCMRYQTLPLASIQGYLIISSLNQPMIQKFLAQGPVAVGVCGTDQSFLFYSGGIYNALNCCTLLNHALLIVGYGHDSASNLDYWIAQNSWGPMWGEKGFMRILRTNVIGSSGQCGLAVSPSTAIGGFAMNIGVSKREMGNYVDKLKEWTSENLQMLTLMTASMMMLLSLFLFSYGWIERKKERERRRMISSRSMSPSLSLSLSHIQRHAQGSSDRSDDDEGNNRRERERERERGVVQRQVAPVSYLSLSQQPFSGPVVEREREREKEKERLNVGDETVHHSVPLSLSLSLSLLTGTKSVGHSDYGSIE
eukprot:CAMPEP_0182438444 /NCGR_PEP_ID=MMETSP1167-20130531/85778_1 /TAXON_ID=2988 /ORGANISM="Mallomonas Sp, Strain CCMP3275" /LENGTH=370 /DNA_ID=CAMNT_0024631823 /DNA_START=2625 /DNA_END=3737 /DNA_ORIENTATION=+